MVSPLRPRQAPGTPMEAPRPQPSEPKDVTSPEKTRVEVRVASADATRIDLRGPAACRDADATEVQPAVSDAMRTSEQDDTRTDDAVDPYGATVLRGASAPDRAHPLEPRVIAAPGPESRPLSSALHLQRNDAAASRPSLPAAPPSEARRGPIFTPAQLQLVIFGSGLIVAIAIAAAVLLQAPVR